MTTTNASINIAVNGLEKLDKLQTSINGVSQKFGGLKGLIATLGVAALGNSALQMADDLQDLSNATGIATARLLEFKKALTTSGGQADQMPNAINKFILAVDEAAQGSIKAQNAFIELGISLNDLRTLSEQELLNKTLTSIAAIEEPSRRAALMMEYFGKSFRTVNPQELADKLASSAGSADKYAETIRRAAELNDQLATAQGTLKLALLETFSPVLQKITDFNTALSEGRDGVESLVTVFKTLATIIAVAFAFTAVGGAVRIIGTVGRGVGSLVGLFGGVGAKISSVFGANSTTMKILRGVGGAVAAIGAGIATVLGLSKETPGGGKSDTADADAAKKAAADQKAAADDAAQRRAVETTQRDNAIRQVREITGEYQKQNKFSLDRLALETQLIGKSDEEKTRQQAMFDLQKQFLDLQDSLIKKRDALGKEEQYLVPVYNEQLKAAQALYDAQVKGMNEILNKQQVANAQEKERQQTIEQINKELERQAAYSDILVSANDKLKRIEFEGKIEGLNEVQKQIARINEEARIGALEAGRAIAATYEGLDLSAEQSDELARKLDNVQQRYKAIADTQIKNLGVSRTFASGWKKAFNEYVDSATNASKVAYDLFNKATSGMEDLIVNFAKTGKFEWKSFVASMAEELLRSQIKQAFSTIMTGMSQSTGILGSIGSLLGLTGGAGAGNVVGQTPNNPMWVKDVSGGLNSAFGGGGGAFGGGQQPGGGIFSGISNVFSGITNTIGNVASSIGNVFSGVTSGISDLISGGGFGGGGGGFFDSITSGIGDFFDGFFANGGNIGAGRFGVVGERGPEFVSGPATVTPMMGGGSVTYNINAVDAASFKALVAADPGFIHAVAQMGGRSVPSRR